MTKCVYAKYINKCILNPSFSRHRSGKKRSMAGNTSIEGEYVTITFKYKQIPIL